MRKLLLLLSLCLAAAPLLAQAPDTITTAAPDALPVATVRADLVPRPYVTAPAAVSTIHPRALTGRDLALTPSDALNRVPGITAQAGALGTHRIVVRGQGARAPFTSNRVRAYLGAIPLTDAEGNTDLEDVDLAVLSRIDVVRGPAATAYGAGMGGVILMAPDFDVPQGFAARADALAGRFGTYRLGAGLSYGRTREGDSGQAAGGQQAIQDAIRLDSR